MTFAPVPAREHAIVLEVRPEGVRGGLFEFGMEQRIALRRTWRSGHGEPLPSFFKLKQFRKVPVIVSLHPELASTFILPFRFNRKKGEGPLQPEGLQGMLQEFLAKTTFEMRSIAAEAFGVEELDAILLDARLTRLLADGVESRDDGTIEGRRIEGFMQATLTTRSVFHDLHDLLHSGRDIFFTENGPAALALLSRHIPGPLTLLDLEPGGGWLFRLDHGAEEIVEKTPFRWSSGDLPLALEDAWGLSKETAGKVYEMLLKGEYSDRVQEFAAKLFAPIEESFEKMLAKNKVTGKAYVRTAMPLPFALPAARAGAKIEEMPLAAMLEESGLAWDPKSDGQPGDPEISLLFLPFLEYYYHRSDPRGHKALTRHIHWIST